MSYNKKNKTKTSTDYSEFRVKKTEIPATPQTKQHPDLESLKNYVQLMLVVALCKYVVNQENFHEEERKSFLRYMMVCS
jgi:hypothetical protein